MVGLAFVFRWVMLFHVIGQLKLLDHATLLLKKKKKKLSNLIQKSGCFEAGEQGSTLR
jgi:hypothetical protein